MRLWLNTLQRAPVQSPLFLGVVSLPLNKFRELRLVLNVHSRLPCRVVNFGGSHLRLEGGRIHYVEEFELEHDGVSIVLARNGII